MSTQQIDYEALAEQARQQAAPKVDYAALAQQARQQYSPAKPLSLYEQARASFAAKQGKVDMPGSFEGHPENMAGYVDTSAGDIGRGAIDIAHGDIAKGGHEVISGTMTGLAPATPFVAAGAPLTFARAAAGGYLTGKVAEGITKEAGGNQDQQAFANDLGNLGGGFVAGAGVPRALLETPTKRLAGNIGGRIASLVKENPRMAQSILNGLEPLEASRRFLKASIKDALDTSQDAASIPGTTQATASGPVPTGAAPVQPMKTVTPSPSRSLSLGDPVKAGDYQVSDVLQGGKPVGKMVYQIDGQRAIIHWIGDTEMENSLSNQLGPMALKQMFLRFAKANPQVQTLEGIRVGGANGEAAATKSVDISDLYGKSPQQNLIPTHQRQLAGQPGRVGVTHNPAPASDIPRVPAGYDEPRVPTSDADMLELMRQSLLRRGITPPSR